MKHLAFLSSRTFCFQLPWSLWHPGRKSVILSSAMNSVFSLYQNIGLFPTNTKCISQVFFSLLNNILTTYDQIGLIPKTAKLVWYSKINQSNSHINRLRRLKKYNYLNICRKNIWKKSRFIHDKNFQQPRNVLSTSKGQLGLPRWLRGKESSCQCRRPRRQGVGSQGWGKIPWKRKRQPTEYSCLANPWQATVQGSHRVSQDWVSEFEGHLKN